eukprot:COSAG06_NODE_491_length_15081_cov_9.093245_9_plen_136_part_00
MAPLPYMQTCSISASFLSAKHQLRVSEIVASASQDGGTQAYSCRRLACLLPCRQTEYLHTEYAPASRDAIVKLCHEGHRIDVGDHAPVEAAAGVLIPKVKGVGVLDQDRVRERVPLRRTPYRRGRVNDPRVGAAA